MSLSEQQKRKIEVTQRIGQFYLQKNHNDYDKTAKEIENLQIADVEVACGSTIIIRLSRIGLFFGVGGENIDKLQEYLGLKIHIVEVDNINSWIIPQKPDYYDPPHWSYRH